MAHEIDLSKYKIRTDLIMDQIGEKEAKGISHSVFKEGDLVIDEVVVEKEGEAFCGKKQGKYITISFSDVTDKENRKCVERVFIGSLEKLLEASHIPKTASCLVIGLGNDKSTPDALGPKVIDHVLVTRHLFQLSDSVEEGYRNVSSFVPGVMGTTGIETSDIILGVVERVKPDFLIVIDALASSSIDRCNRTIQMSDSGIAPGSGVGNHRNEISKETMHIPVIVIGIPTVVDAATIVSDTIHYMMKQFSYNKENFNRASSKFSTPFHRNYLNSKNNLSSKEREQLLGMVGCLDEEEVKSLIFEVLTPIGYNLMVTPKEIDFLIDQLSSIIGRGINFSLHENYHS